MSERVLEACDVVSGYGDLEVLHGVTVHVDRGEVVALVGSNGAGKTTLMRTITGQLPCRSGEIRVAGGPLARLRPHQIVKRGVSLVPEGRLMFVGLSVEDNLRLGGHGLPRRLVDTRIDENYNRFPILRERRGQDAGSLSGGQQQMLAIARALMRGPQLLLLDEPSMGLAPIVVAEVFATVRALRDSGVSVLVVEQNVKVLESADRALVLESGVVTREDSAADLMTDPTLSAAFLGADRTSPPVGAPSSVEAASSLPPQ